MGRTLGRLPHLLDELAGARIQIKIDRSSAAQIRDQGVETFVGDKKYTFRPTFSHTVPELSIRTTTDPDLDSSYLDRCSFPQELADRLDLDEREHVRVDRNPYATYYRIWKTHEDPADSLLIHEDGLDRFGVESGDFVELSTTIPRESLDEARENGGLAESLRDDGEQDRVLVTAPHGGGVERGTDAMATHTYRLLVDADVPASLWMLHGFNPPEESEVTSHKRWHIGKPVDGASGYPGLKELLDRRFDHVVAFHRSGYSEIEVGGQVDAAVRERVADQLRERTGKEVWTDLDRLRLPGTHERVSTNYLSKDGGLHIECTPGTCNDYQREAAEAVVAVLREFV